MSKNTQNSDIRATIKNMLLDHEAAVQENTVRAIVLNMVENGEVGSTEGGVASLKETSQLLAGISTREIHRKCESGELDKVKLGPRVSGVTRASIRNYIRRNKVKPGKQNGQCGCEE